MERHSDDQSPTGVDSELTRTVDGASAQPEFSGVGQRLGDFDLLREIGRGGMGVVYEARQLSLNRRVALKVLPHGLGLTPEAVQRFAREARAAAKLHHTNIVPVHAIGEEAGSHFYAMELVEGQSLAAILADVQQQGTELIQQEQTMTRLLTEAVGAAKPTEEAEAVEEVARSDVSVTGRAWFDTVAAQLADVAEALEYAHGRGVIHRDIKPANLLLSREGCLCITDFGLARVSQEPGMTTTGAMLGTPAYMSPEQVRGRGVDRRTDVYSLGVVLYEMLTLRRPFAGQTREEVVQAILTREPVAPRRINRRVPLDLETICLRALEKNPDKRYRTAGALAHDLRQYLGRGLITARRAGPIERFTKLVRRHPLAATVGAAAVSVSLIGGFALYVSAARAREALQRAVSDAQFLLSQGSYREALGRVEQALTRDPGLVEARLLRARLLMDLRRHDEAVVEARSLLDLNTDDWTAHLILAVAAKGGGAGARPMGVSIDEHLAVVERNAPRTADTYYLRSLARRSHAEAVELLDRALTLNPAHADALLARIRHRLALKDFREALLDCERLIVARPRSAVGRRMRAETFWRLDDYRSALREISPIIDAEPDVAVNHWLRGELHLSLHEFEAAAEDFSVAVDLAPDVAQFRFRRGAAFAGIGEHERAIDDYRRTLDLDPAHLEAYGALIQLHRGLEQPERARRLAGRLTGVVDGWTDPIDQAEAYRLLARIHVGLADADGALALAEKAITLDPGHYDGYLARADVRRMFGDDTGYREDCVRSSEVKLREPDGLNDRAPKLGFRCGRWDLGLRDASALVEVAPGWSAAWVRRAWAHGLLGRYVEANADAERAVELAPRSVYALNARAVWLKFDPSVQRSLVWTKTEELFSEILDLAPHSAAVRVNRGGFARRFLGRLDEALEDLDESIRVDPSDCIALWARAIVLAHLGRCKDAMRDIERALALSPNDSTIHEDAALFYAVSMQPACREHADPDRAWTYAERAVELEPPGGQASVRLAVGVARYRLGRLSEARTALLEARESLLERKLAIEDELDENYVHFFLAMTNWRLGRRHEAQRDLERARGRVVYTNREEDPDMVWLEREAATLLASPSPPGS